MSLLRTIRRKIELQDARTQAILHGKVATGNTQSLRMALTGNNPSRMKQAIKQNRRITRATAFARALTACLIKAVGGDVPPVAVDYSREARADRYHRSIAERGTTISKPTARKQVAV